MLTLLPVILLLLMIILLLVLLPKATLYGNMPIFSHYGSRRPGLSNTAGAHDKISFFPTSHYQTPQSTCNIVQFKLLIIPYGLYIQTLWEVSGRGLTDTGRQISLSPPLFAKVVCISSLSREVVREPPRHYYDPIYLNPIRDLSL